MESESMFARITDVVACGMDNSHSFPENSYAESLVSHDSVESLLERGDFSEASVWDPEAYRFAQWWHAASATRFVQCQGSQSRVAAARTCYRHYATEQAQTRIASVLQVPAIAREIIKQDFLSVRLLFDKGVACAGATYYLTSALSERILSFLGHRPRFMLQMTVRSEVPDAKRMCPLFQHRIWRMAGLQQVASGLQLDTETSSRSSSSDRSGEKAMSEYSFALFSSSASSDGGDDGSEYEMLDDASVHEMLDDSSVYSSGSVSAAHDRLQSYLRSQR